MTTQRARVDAGVADAYAHRTEPFDWAGYKKDGTIPLVITEQDEVRFKLAKTSDGDPLLDLTTTPTDNGSRVIIDSVGEVDVSPVSGRVILAQEDTLGFSGEYFWELLLVDADELNPEDATKLICRGQLIFKKTIGGTVGLV